MTDSDSWFFVSINESPQDKKEHKILVYVSLFHNDTVVFPIENLSRIAKSPVISLSSKNIEDLLCVSNMYNQTKLIYCRQTHGQLTLTQTENQHKKQWRFIMCIKVFVQSTHAFVRIKTDGVQRNRSFLQVLLKTQGIMQEVTKLKNSEYVSLMWKWVFDLSKKKISNLFTVIYLWRFGWF